MASLYLNPPPSSSNLFSLKKNPTSTTTFSRFPLLKNPNLSLFRPPKSKTNSRKLLKFSANNTNNDDEEEETKKIELSSMANPLKEDDESKKTRNESNKLERSSIFGKLDEWEKSMESLHAEWEKSMKDFRAEWEKTESSLKVRNESNELDRRGKSLEWLNSIDNFLRKVERFLENDLNTEQEEEEEEEEEESRDEVNELIRRVFEESEKRDAKISAEMLKSIETLQEYKKYLDNSFAELNIFDAFCEYMIDPTMENAKFIERLGMIKKKISNPFCGLFYESLLLWVEEEIHDLKQKEIGSSLLKVNKMESCFEHDTFFVTDVRRVQCMWTFTGFLKKPVEEVLPKLEKKLSEATGMDVIVYFKEDEYDMTKQVCTVEPKSSRDAIFEYTNQSKDNIPAIVLCIASFGTTAWMNSFLLKPNATYYDYLANGVPLFGGLFSIFGVSEIATRMTAARYGVKLSPSYLIPSIWTGLLGVLNNYESPLPNNKALFDIPAARTASAYLTSLVLVVTAFVVDGSFNGGDNPMYISPGFFSYNSLLSYIQSVIGPYRDDFGNILPYVVEGVGVPVNPLAFAGIIGMAVTSINLLPFQRMEGGRISQALFGQFVAEGLNGSFGLLLLAIGLLDGNVLCLVWWLVLSRRYEDESPVKDGITPLGDERRTLGFILQVMCILTLLPNIAGRFSVFNFFGEIYEVISSSLSYNS